MKKIFLFVSLVVACLFFAWCEKVHVMDWDWMERSAEQICLDFDGQISETEDWEAICILPNDEFCYMFDIEDGGCDLLGYEYEYEWDMPSSVYCEENWWTYQIRLEWGEEQEVCTFDDDSFCYFDDLVAWNCSKWEFYYDEDEVEEYDAIYESCLSAWEDLVCWKDGNTYFNRCMMMLEWVEEETELAEIIDWECVFG